MASRFIVEKRKYKKGKFTFVTFLNANRFKKSNGQYQGHCFKGYNVVDFL